MNLKYMNMSTRHQPNNANYTCVFFLFVDGSTNQRWAFNRHGDEEDFVSRYNRMTDAGNDYSVFTSNLPGMFHQ